MNILLTGGTGFLGKAVAKRLAGKGHSVTVTGRNAKAGAELESAGVAFLKLDLSDSGMGEACRGRDQVIHCAALASPWGKYEDFFRANVEGTRTVVEACLAGGVKRLVNLSSPSVYFDYRHRENIRESDPLPKRQVTHYGATKVLADAEVAKGQARGLETISLRPRALFGPGDQTILGRVLRAADQGSIPLIGGGRSLVDMTYIDNAVDAVELCLSAPDSALGQVYNITNGEPLSTRAMLDVLFESLGRSVSYRNLPFPLAYAGAAASELIHSAFRRPGEPPLTRYAIGLMSRSQTLDISSAREKLGYRPRVALAEGFERFARWWKQKT